MPNIIELNLLENRSIVAKMQGIPLANENSYKIIAGEENATIFKVVSIPNQYADKSFTIEMVNAKGYGIEETPIVNITNYEFSLPVGMAVAGYSYILFRCKYTENGKQVVVPFQPLKIKVWNTIPQWQDFVDKTTNVRVENGYLILTENGTEYNLGYVQGEDGKTPYIGGNGNWFVGEEDTGVPAKCEVSNEYVNEQIDKAVSPIKKDIADLYLLSNATVTGTEEITEEYTTRQTANGLSGLIDGALTRVEKIQGDTVATDSGLKNAYFEGVKSTGKNLLKPYGIERTVTHRGITFKQNVDGSVILNGQKDGVAGNSLFPLSRTVVLKAGTYRGSTGPGYFILLFTTPDNKDTIFYSSRDTILANDLTGYWRMYVPKDNTTLFENYMAYPRVYYSGVEDTFEPYKEVNLSLNLPIELGEWDYIDFARKKVVRQTATLTRETAFTEEELADYSEYVLSNDGLTLAYKAETATEEDIDIPTNKYQAWVNGSETVVQGEIDNSEYGAECAITQIYAVKKGGVE